MKDAEAPAIVERNWSESKYASLFGQLLPAALSLLLGLLLSSFENDRYVAEERASVANQLSQLRGRLELELSKTMRLTRGLAAIVAVKPQLQQSEFESLAAELVASRAHIRNIGLAPDNVLRMIYPLPGNQAALGLRYRNNSAQWPAVEHMMTIRRTVVAGPVDLVQGGRGLVSRTPVYVGANRQRYWGLISVVIDMDSLFSAAGLMEERNLQLALRGKDGLGAAGEVFWGQAEIFQASPAVLPVLLAEGEWQLAASPRRGWSRFSPYLYWLWIPLLISGLAIGLFVRSSIIRQRRRYEEMRRMTREAQAANLAKSEFLAAMSHEIRTPLNATLGFAEILQEEIETPQHREYLDTIRKSSKALLDLLNDILDFSKIEAGKLAIHSRDFAWRDVLDEIEAMVRYSLLRKKLDWKLEIAEDLPPVIYSDEHRLRQVLLNLIGNAVKYTDEGGVSVSVSASKTAAGRYDFCFRVSDSGPGIPQDKQASIFDAFVQHRPAEDMVREGVGLGLAISSRLAAMLGGRIDLSSTPGQGSEFTLWLPGLEGRDRASAADSPADAAAMQRAFRDETVLVIDDNEDNRLLIRHYLKNDALRVVEAENGWHGIEIARRMRPQLILLDLHMPVMDGFQFVERLAADPTLRQTPILIFTADVIEERLSRLNPAHVAGVLKKPLRKQELREALAACLNAAARPMPAE